MNNQVVYDWYCSLEDKSLNVVCASFVKQFGVQVLTYCNLSLYSKISRLYADTNKLKKKGNVDKLRKHYEKNLFYL